jgi:chemotaxis signal transduction protein
VVKIPASDVEPSPTSLHEGGLNCVTGLAKYQGRLIVLLDMTKLLDLGAMQNKVAVSENNTEVRRASAGK